MDDVLSLCCTFPPSLLKSSSLFLPHAASSPWSSGSPRISSGHSAIFHISAAQNMQSNQNFLQLKCKFMGDVYYFPINNALLRWEAACRDTENWTFFFCINTCNFAVFDRRGGRVWVPITAGWAPLLLPCGFGWHRLSQPLKIYAPV